MNILYCGDQGIKNGVLVSILSILMRSGKENEYHFYIATIDYKNTKPFQKSTVKFLDTLAKSYNCNNLVELIDATEVFVNDLPDKNMGSYFTPCSMLRLYINRMPEIASLKRVLYLDYDVIARGDFGDFYNTDMDDVEAAGVVDIYGKYFYHYRGLFNFDYINSGVMLFNMNECLKNNVFGRATQLCKKRKMMLADQAALNKVISKRKLMPRKYNEQADKPKNDTVLHHFSNNFKFWPYFRVQKIKPFEIDKIHSVLKITEYDDIFKEYEKLKENL
ncbi:glycosyltransferase family 8 protein [Candidatus Saccharibacteria bacterium]|nr:glycosyltransferase family 8 protein [Candidatus Saccharibacteria bacterium]